MDPSKKPPSFLELQIRTENSELKKKLQEAIRKHNYNFHSSLHPDSGFDLFNPENELVFPAKKLTKMDLGVQCAMVRHTYSKVIPVGFCIYSRSSTPIKTPLRLANNVGIIDSGYRGILAALFDNISDDDYYLSNAKTDRFVQICAGNLEPFLVSLVDELDETERGSGGFGSTH